MLTNEQLYELISKQMNNSNEDIREQLKSQIEDKTAQTNTMAKKLADRQYSQICSLSKEINDKLNVTRSVIMQSEAKSIEQSSESVIQQLKQYCDEKIESVRTELLDKIENQVNLIISANKSMSDGISNIQKDTAVIMKTLQLILTNMVLDDVEIEKNSESDKGDN